MPNRLLLAHHGDHLKSVTFFAFEDLGMHVIYVSRIWGDSDRSDDSYLGQTDDDVL